MVSKNYETLYSLHGDRDQDEKILRPIAYAPLPKQGFQMKNIYSFNYWFKLTAEKLQPIIDIGYFITYKYFTLIDDIVDDSELREGIPSAHMVYGYPRTISAANYALLIALERVMSLDNPKAVQQYLSNSLDYHRAAAMEIFWRENFICPTEAEFTVMSSQKVSGFYNILVNLMQHYSDCKKDFRRLVHLLSLFDSFSDDYIDVVSSPSEDEHSDDFCHDLTEGKYSFPVIHAIHNSPDGEQISNILRQKPKSAAVKKYFISLLKKSGSLDYTVQVVLDIEKQIREEIQKLGGNPDLISLLDERQKTFMDHVM